MTDCFFGPPKRKGTCNTARVTVYTGAKRRDRSISICVRATIMHNQALATKGKYSLTSYIYGHLPLADGYSLIK